MRVFPRPTASSVFQSDPGWKMWLGERACSQRKESQGTGPDFAGGLKDVRLDDSVDVYTEKGNTHYVVDEIRIVRPGDVSVLGPRPRSSITLTSWCWSRCENAGVHPFRASTSTILPSASRSFVSITSPDECE
jgi:hypothetical protein